MNGSPLLLDRAELDDRSEFRDAVLAGLDSSPRARRRNAVASTGRRLPMVEPGKKPMRRRAALTSDGKRASVM